MKARKSRLFWTDKPRVRLYFGSRSLLRYSDFLPHAGWLIFDGRGNLSVNEALGTDWPKIGRVRHLSILSAGNFVSSRFDRFANLEELEFFELFLEDTEFLTILPRLKTLRLIESELADWNALQYAKLEKLYIGGASVAGAVCEESEAIVAGASTVFLDMDCIEATEKLGYAKLDYVDTWGVELWERGEVEALNADLDAWRPTRQ